jgi:hypothetical protein
MSATESKTATIEPFVRGKSGCLQLITSEYWGSWYRAIDDPKGKDVNIKELLSQFWIKPDFDKVPLIDLRRIVTFYRKYISNVAANSTVDTNEVQVLLPKQIITLATVEAVTHPCCDLETGEDYDIFPPVGWVHAGSSHSHNTMSAFFSPKDDLGELTVPGLHFVIGSITAGSYDIKASIVMNRARFLVPPTHVLESGDIPVVINDALVARFTDSETVPYATEVETYVKRAQDVRNSLGVKRLTYHTANSYSYPNSRRRIRKHSSKNAPYSWTPGINYNELEDFSDLLGNFNEISQCQPCQTVTVTGRPELLSSVAFDLAEILKDLKYTHPEIVFDALVKHGYLSAEEALQASGEITETEELPLLSDSIEDAEWSTDPLETSFIMLASLLSDLKQEDETKDTVYGMLGAQGLINAYPSSLDWHAVSIGEDLVKGTPITFPDKNLVKLAKTLDSLLLTDECDRIVCGILINLDYLNVKDLCGYLSESELQRGIIEAYDYTLTFTDSNPELSAAPKLPEPDWSDFV